MNNPGVIINYLNNLKSTKTLHKHTYGLQFYCSNELDFVICKVHPCLHIEQTILFIDRGSTRFP